MVNDMYLLRFLALVEFNESILQRVTGLLVPDDLTTHDGAETRKYELQIFVPSHGVKFAHKKYILWRSYVGEG